MLSLGVYIDFLEMVKGPKIGQLSALSCRTEGKKMNVYFWTVDFHRLKKHLEIIKLD